MAETCFIYPSDSVVKCENAILDFLSYKALVPTSSEILKLLLTLANPVQDFSSMVKKCNEHIFKALVNYEFCYFRYSSIALASLLICLENLNYKTFYHGILDMIEINEIQFDLSEVLLCKKQLCILLDQEMETEQSQEQIAAKKESEFDP